MTGASLASLALVALLAVGAAAARRWLRPPGARELEVAARAPLGREAGLALVRAGGETLLVGWGRDGVRLVARMGPERAP